MATDNKINIALVNISKFNGGAERSLFELISNFDKKKFKVHLLTNKNIAQNCFNKIPIDVKRIESFVRVSKKKRDIILFVLKYIYAGIEVASYCKKNNIRLLYFNTQYSFIYAPIIRRLINIKIIYHIRDNPFNKYLYRRILKPADSYICVSDYISKQLPEMKNKYTVYNGIDTHQFDYLNANNILLTGKINFVVVGQITPRKNIQDIISIIELLNHNQKSIHIHVVGAPYNNKDNSYLNKIIEIIKSKNIGSYITFHGYIKNINDFIKHNDIHFLLHLSKNEPFGRVIIEAMAIGIIVFAYNGGSISELINDGIDGFASQPLPANLVNKIKHFLKTVERSENIKNNAQKKIENKFNILRQAQKIDVIITKTINNESTV